MIPPPAGATPYLYIPNNAGNRGSTGAVFAWGQWKALVNTAMPQGLIDMLNIQAADIGPVIY